MFTASQDVFISAAIVRLFKRYRITPSSSSVYEGRLESVEGLLLFYHMRLAKKELTTLISSV